MISTAAASLARAANIEDLRDLARRRLPRMVFDYLDGAAGDEATAQRNRAALGRVLLQADVLKDMSQRSTATTLFGQAVALPVVIGPTGMNGAYWPQGDLCLARAAKAEHIPFVMSTAATVGLNELTAAAGPLRWFQLYMLRDRGLISAFLQRVYAAGFAVLELTVDTTVVGPRRRDVRNGFALPLRWDLAKLLDMARRLPWAWQMAWTGSPTLRLFAEVMGTVPAGSMTAAMQSQMSDSFSWADLDWLRRNWPGQLVLKGIESATHARLATDAGVDGVVVSNHGGRQLDAARASIEQLPEVVDAAAGRLQVLIDGGFRSGADIAKAIALGANAVQLGRPTLYGLAAGGEAGARRAVQLLKTEFVVAQALCGATTVEGLRGRAWHATW